MAAPPVWAGRRPRRSDELAGRDEDHPLDLSFSKNVEREEMFCLI